jgi:hypothetical protein
LGGVLMDGGSVGALARPDASTGVFIRVSTGGSQPFVAP